MIVICLDSSLTMFPGMEGCLCQLKVAVRGCGNDYHVNHRILQHVFHTPICLDPREIFFGVIFRLGAPLHHRIELEIGNGLDERNMKGFGAESVPNDANIVLLRAHILISLLSELWDLTLLCTVLRPLGGGGNRVGAALRVVRSMRIISRRFNRVGLYSIQTSPARNSQETKLLYFSSRAVILGS